MLFLIAPQTKYMEHLVGFQAENLRENDPNLLKLNQNCLDVTNLDEC